MPTDQEQHRIIKQFKKFNINLAFNVFDLTPIEELKARKFVEKLNYIFDNHSGVSRDFATHINQIQYDSDEELQ